MWDPVAMRRLGMVGIAATLIVAGCGDVRRIPPQAEPAEAPVDLSSPSNPDRVGEAAQVGAGATPRGPWRAWIYRTGGGEFCLEVNGVNGGNIDCGAADSFGSSYVASTAWETIVAGSTRKQTAVAAVVRLSDGAVIRLPLVAPGSVVTDGRRFFVGSVPVGPEVRTIELVDPGGNVLESTTFSTTPDASRSTSPDSS